MARRQDLDRARAFLLEHGVAVVTALEAPWGVQPFRPGSGVWLSSGTVFYDHGVAQAGDLLHEAGHVALVPERLHDGLTGMAVSGEVERWARSRLGDADLVDDGAVAWSWAAALACSVDPLRVLDSGFDRHEVDAVAAALRHGSARGVGVLVELGLLGAKERWPNLDRWLVAEGRGA